VDNFESGQWVSEMIKIRGIESANLRATFN